MPWLCIGYCVVYRSYNTIAVLHINSIVRTKICLFFGKSRYFGLDCQATQRERRAYTRLHMVSLAREVGVDGGSNGDLLTS